MAFIEVKNRSGEVSRYINTNTIVCLTDYLGGTKIKFIDGSTMEVQGKKEKLIDMIRFAEVTD